MTDIKTQGTQLKLGDGASPEVFTLIAGVSQIAGLGGGESDDIDVTDFDSTAKEYLVGLSDEGTVTFSLNYSPTQAQQDALETHRTDSTVANFELLLSDGTTTFSFAAFVKRFEFDLQANDAVRASVSLRLTGAVTKTTA